MNNVYNPDVLLCLANLSNDEVFTPPELANDVLDLLPASLWRNKDAKFLDPVSKSGVFLREIVKRLDRGLESQIPNKQRRIDHILSNQVYGIAITELTALISRRSVYCSKNANGRYSISKAFESAEGNILYKRLDHEWIGDKCVFCGALKSKYDRGEALESYAYNFIHTYNPNEFFNMKFDVIIGNPPYQLNFGIEGGNSSNAKSIYNEFISQSISLKPRYLCMITPSRWMTKTAQGIPDKWVEEMIKSNNIEILHDFPDASHCFPGVEIKGGVSYFLWSRDYNGKCHYFYHDTGKNTTIERFDFLDSTNAGVVIRDPKANNIIEKIEKVEGRYYINSNDNFSGMVSPKHFFDNGILLTSNWSDYQLESSDITPIKYYISAAMKGRPFGWISLNQIPKNQMTVPLHKVYIPAAGGTGNDSQILGRPIYGEPNSVCSQTYLVIGYDPERHNFNYDHCQNIISYVSTKFFRYLVSIKKKTQNGPRGVYQFVPQQDYSRPLNDEFLYERYNLSIEEIELIESSIKAVDY